MEHFGTTPDPHSGGETDKHPVHSMKQRAGREDFYARCGVSSIHDYAVGAQIDLTKISRRIVPRCARGLPVQTCRIGRSPAEAVEAPRSAG